MRSGERFLGKSCLSEKKVTKGKKKVKSGGWGVIQGLSLTFKGRG